MADLSLEEYRDLSGKAIKRLLRREARRMFSGATFEDHYSRKTSFEKVVEGRRKGGEGCSASGAPQVDCNTIIPPQQKHLIGPS